MKSVNTDKPKITRDEAYVQTLLSSEDDDLIKINDSAYLLTDKSFKAISTQAVLGGVLDRHRKTPSVDEVFDYLPPIDDYSEVPQELSLARDGGVSMISASTLKYFLMAQYNRTNNNGGDR